MPNPIIAFIVAVAENGVIGRGGQLPWRIPSDLKRFRQLTMGKPVVMGRRTYVSIGKALDGRDNIVVTRDAGFQAPGITVVASVDDAVKVARQFALARGVDEIMVIGGAEIFAAALPLADRVYLTRIHASPPGDVTLPALTPAEWTETRREAIPPDPRDDATATLIVYDRVRPSAAP